MGNGLIVPGAEPAYTTRTEPAALKTERDLRDAEVNSRFERVEGLVTKLEGQVRTSSADSEKYKH